MGLSLPTPDERQGERNKYLHCYTQSTYKYGMGGARMADAVKDLEWALTEIVCNVYLDIGCGRGEMLDHADEMGFSVAHGAEIVPELLQDGRVFPLMIHQLDKFQDEEYDFVTSFDVIEHVLPDDDTLLIMQLGRIAKRALALTANNHRSVDPTTGADLHVNKRPYDEWDKKIRALLEPDWTVQRMTDKAYVSETWRAWK